MSMAAHASDTAPFDALSIIIDASHVALQAADAHIESAAPWTVHIPWSSDTLSIAQSVPLGDQQRCFSILRCAR